MSKVMSKKTILIALFVIFVVTLLLIIVLIKSSKIQEANRDDINRVATAGLKEIAYFLEKESIFPDDIDELREFASLHELDVMDWNSLHSSCRRDFAYAVDDSRTIAVIISMGKDSMPMTGDDIVVFVKKDRYLEISDDLKRQLIKKAWAVSSCTKLNLPAPTR